MGSRLPQPKTVDPTDLVGAVGAPPFDIVRPQLATLADTAPDGPGWVHEIKYDGYRMLAHVANGTTELYSQNGLTWTRKLPELAALTTELPVGEAIFDGTLCHVLPNGVTNFGALQSDLSAKRTDGLVFFIFDLVYLNGFRLDQVELHMRKYLLEYIMYSSPDHRLRFSEYQTGGGPKFFKVAASVPVEGIVSKRRDSKYRSGRQTSWLKINVRQ